MLRRVVTTGRHGKVCEMMTIPRQRRRPGAGRPAIHTYGDSSRPENKVFGSWLQSMILSRGMNQAEFAEKVDASPTTVSRWINGRVPAGKYLQRIADVLLLDYDLVATKAGYRPTTLDRHRDPESPEAQLMPLIQRIDWTDDRLSSAMALLRSFVEASRRDTQT